MGRLEVSGKSRFMWSVWFNRVASGQEMVSEKKKGLKDQEIVREFYFKSEKVDVLKKSQGNLKL